MLNLAARKPEHHRQTAILDRGNWQKPTVAVTPGVPAALHPLPQDAAPNRLTFARWLVDRRSPTTARVAVNRVWQSVFGIGIVETAEDFGVRASTPSHPELLDWLAVDFMDHDWSLKHLLRTIVTSATYRQDSRFTDELLERDPKNRLLARGPRFRVDAEVARDTVLAASGLLNRKRGGPSFFPPVPESHVCDKLHTGSRLLADGFGAGAVSPVAIHIPPTVDARPGVGVVRRAERRLFLCRGGLAPIRHWRRCPR